MADAKPQPTRNPIPGFVSHTELVSNDPTATKTWCESVIGWKFGPPAKMMDGRPYEMWSHENTSGGGIRANMPDEPTGTVPYVEVEDIDVTFNEAVAAGADIYFGPMKLETGGRIAMVKAPGGVPLGFWSSS